MPSSAAIPRTGANVSSVAALSACSSRVKGALDCWTALRNLARRSSRIPGFATRNGNLSFTGQGGDRTVNYSGRAALLVYGDVDIDTNLITCNNGDKTNTANSFSRE